MGRKISSLMRFEHSTAVTEHVGQKIFPKSLSYLKRARNVYIIYLSTLTLTCKSVLTCETQGGGLITPTRQLRLDKRKNRMSNWRNEDKWEYEYLCCFCFDTMWKKTISNSYRSLIYQMKAWFNNCILWRLYDIFIGHSALCLQLMPMGPYELKLEKEDIYIVD